MKAIILRGPSGVGKSTFARHLKVKLEQAGKKAVIVSADDFFMGWSGFVMGAEGEGRSHMEYHFDPTKLPEAHQTCFNKYLDALIDNVDVVIADNTFTRLWEVQNYIKAAELAGYVVEIYEFRVTTIEQLRECVKRNAHKVPQEAVTKHVTEFEHIEGATQVNPWNVK